jgi:hypothetical protein
LPVPHLPGSRQAQVAARKRLTPYLSSPQTQSGHLSAINSVKIDDAMVLNVFTSGK